MKRKCHDKDETQLHRQPYLIRQQEVLIRHRQQIGASLQALLHQIVILVHQFHPQEEGKCLQIYL